MRKACAAVDDSQGLRWCHLTGGLRIRSKREEPLWDDFMGDRDVTCLSLVIAIDCCVLCRELWQSLQTHFTLKQFSEDLVKHKTAQTSSARVRYGHVTKSSQLDASRKWYVQLRGKYF